MPLVSPSEFNGIIDTAGQTVTRTPRIVTSHDDFNEAVYTLGSPDSFVAVVLDLSTRELKNSQGIFEFGDKEIFVKSTVRVAPTDRLDIDGLPYQTVSETTEKVTGAVIVRSYVVRRTKE